MNFHLYDFVDLIANKKRTLHDEVNFVYFIKFLVYNQIWIHHLKNVPAMSASSGSSKGKLCCLCSRCKGYSQIYQKTLKSVKIWLVGIHLRTSRCLLNQANFRNWKSTGRFIMMSRKSKIIHKTYKNSR